MQRLKHRKIISKSLNDIALQKGLLTMIKILSVKNISDEIFGF